MSILDLQDLKTKWYILYMYTNMLYVWKFRPVSVVHGIPTQQLLALVLSHYHSGRLFAQ